jgi:hypothetical protein
MEIHGKIGLLATVSVAAGKSGFSLTRPGAVPTPPTQVKDAKAIAAHLLEGVKAPRDEDRLPLPPGGHGPS